MRRFSVTAASCCGCSLSVAPASSHMGSHPNHRLSCCVLSDVDAGNRSACRPQAGPAFRTAGIMCARCFSTSLPMLKSASGTGISGGKHEDKKRHSDAQGRVATAPGSGTACEEPQRQVAAAELSAEAAAAAAAVTLARTQLKKRRASRAGRGDSRGTKKPAASAAEAPTAPVAASTTSGRSSGKRAARGASKVNAPAGGGGKRSRGSSHHRGGDDASAGQARPKDAAAPVGAADDDAGHGTSLSRSTSSTVAAYAEDGVALAAAEGEKGKVLRSINDAFSVSPLYFTESALSERRTAPTEADLIAERASITKLFVISDSVASIFSALPHDQSAIDNYLSEVDKAVPATPRATPTATDASHDCDSQDLAGMDSLCDADDALYFNAEKEDPMNTYDVMQRVLVEQNADHALCIHVRDMEQLVPPAHLLSDPKPVVPAASPAAAATATRRGSGRTVWGRRGSARRAAAQRHSPRSPDDISARPAEAAAVPVESPLTPAEMAMRTLNRIKALNEWRAQALLRATQSQRRWALPDDCHSITRVRMHEPHQADLTVVQGCGGPKSVEDVLAAMRRKLGGEGRWGSGGLPLGDAAAEDDDVDDGNVRTPRHGDMSTDLGRLNAMGALAMRSVEPTAARHGAMAMRGAAQLEGGSAIATTASAAASAPFALKPLLTVYASCIPRRESQLGAPYDEALFRSQSDLPDGYHHRQLGLSWPHPSKTLSPSDAFSAANEAPADALASAQQDIPLSQRKRLTDEEVYAIIKGRGVPPMPRYSTRITLLVEHNELEPSDLLSLAEITTARKEAAPTATGSDDATHRCRISSSSSSHSRGAKGRASGSGSSSPAAGKAKRKKHHIYCLVVDGGEL